MIWRADAATATAGIIDPNLPGIQFIQDALQLSGLNVVRGVVGSPVVVAFTASDISLGGAVIDGADTITGAVVDSTGLIVATFGGVTITVGPFGNSLSGGGFKGVTLTSSESLTASAAGQTYVAWVGPASEMAAYGVGDYLPTNANTMLNAAFTVPGTSTGSSGGASSSSGSGTGTGGFSSPPPANQGGSTPLSAGNILTWVEGHWQVVVLGGVALLLAPTILNATASVTTAEKRLQAARRGS